MRPERLSSLVKAAERAGKTVVRARVTADGEIVLEFDTAAKVDDIDLVEWKK